MSSGVARMAVGSFTGTGAILSIQTLDFRPRKLELLNLGGLAKGEWVEGMADDSVLKQVTAGTISLPTSGGVTPLNNGFTLGADADLNVSGELVRYVAHE